MYFTHFSNSVQPACPVSAHRAQQALGLLDGSAAAEETDQHHQTSGAYQDVHTWSSRDSRQPLISCVNGGSRHNGARCKKYKVFLFSCFLLYYSNKETPAGSCVYHDRCFSSLPLHAAACSVQFLIKVSREQHRVGKVHPRHLRSGRLLRLMVKLAVKANLLLCLAEQSSAWAVSDQFKMCLFKKVSRQADSGSPGASPLSYTAPTTSSLAEVCREAGNNSLGSTEEVRPVAGRRPSGGQGWGSDHRPTVGRDLRWDRGRDSAVG